MTKTAIITGRVSSELQADVDRLASLLDRSRAWIIAAAVERYVKEELEFLAFLKEGEDDIDAGRLRSQDEVETIFGVSREARDAA